MLLLLDVFFGSRKTEAGGKSACLRFIFASLGFRLVGANSASLRFRLRRKLHALPCYSSPHANSVCTGASSWRLASQFPYFSVSSSACHRFIFASLGFRLVGANSASLRFRLRRKLHALPCSFSPHANSVCTGASLWRLASQFPYFNVSSSACHRFIFASLGIRQSPRGEKATEPTLGPSGRQFRLNC